MPASRSAPSATRRDMTQPPRPCNDAMVGIPGTAPGTGQRLAAWARVAVAVAVVDTIAVAAALVIAAEASIYLPIVETGSLDQPGRRPGVPAPGRVHAAQPGPRPGPPAAPGPSGLAFPWLRRAVRRHDRAACLRHVRLAPSRPGHRGRAPGSTPGCGSGFPPACCLPCCGSPPATCPGPGGAGPSAASPSRSPRSGSRSLSRPARCPHSPCTSPTRWAGLVPDQPCASSASPAVSRSLSPRWPPLPRWAGGSTAATRLSAPSCAGSLLRSRSSRSPSRCPARRRSALSSWRST